MFDAALLDNNNSTEYNPFCSFGHVTTGLPLNHSFAQQTQNHPFAVMNPCCSTSDPTTNPCSMNSSASHSPDIRSPYVTQMYSNNNSSKHEDDRDSVRSSVSNTESVDTGVHVCVDCGKTFAERIHLTRHRVTHSAAKYLCHLCNRPFMRDDKLKRHIRCVHSTERPFQCDVCSKAFARKDKLQEHVRHHNKDITFPCSICSEIFVMRSHLNRHLRTVHKLKLNGTSAQAAKSLPTPTPPSCHVMDGNETMENKSAFTPVNTGNYQSAHASLYNPHAGYPKGLIAANSDSKQDGYHNAKAVGLTEPTDNNLRRLMVLNENMTTNPLMYYPPIPFNSTQQIAGYGTHIRPHASSVGNQPGQPPFLIDHARSPWSAAMAASLLARPAHQTAWWSTPPSSATDLTNQQQQTTNQVGFAQWDAQQQLGATQPPTQMLASLPPFAQAMYYQAASWAAASKQQGAVGASQQPPSETNLPTSQ